MLWSILPWNHWAWKHIPGDRDHKCIQYVWLIIGNWNRPAFSWQLCWVAWAITIYFHTVHSYHADAWMLQVIFSRAKGKYLEIPLACMFSRDAIFTSYSQLRSKMGDSESESELEPAPNFTNLEPEPESVLGLPITNTYNKLIYWVNRYTSLRQTDMRSLVSSCCPDNYLYNWTWRNMRWI